MLGQVKKYYRKKGYGFITGDDGNEYFVSYADINTPSRSLDEGYTVEFTASKNDHGCVAKNVRLF